MTEVTENVTEVTENITEVTKHGFGTKSMAVYGRVWLLWPCIAVYRRILQYIAVYCSISQYIAFPRGQRSKFIWSCFNKNFL